MKRVQTIPALGAFFVLVAVLLAGCGSGMPGNSVAVVAGNPITRPAFDHWMYVIAKSQIGQEDPGAPVIVPNDPPEFTNCIAQARAEIPAVKKYTVKQLRSDCSTLFTSLKSTTMSFLITAYWYQAEGHKLGIKVTDAEVNTALAAAKKSDQLTTAAAYATFLKQSGQTQQDIVYRFRVQQFFNKLTAREPTKVTPAAIAAYYTAHKSQFGTPEMRNLRIVLAKTQAGAQAALSALKGGQSWTKVAKQYSIDPTTKNVGGVLTGVTANQQDAALSQAAFAAPLNKLVGPVKSQFGYYVIDVTKITASTQRSLAVSTTLIKQTLTTQLQTSAQTKVQNEVKKAWLGKTTCRTVYAIADCTGYKAPKTTTSSAAAATAPATGSTAPATGSTAPATGSTAPAQTSTAP